MSQNIVNLLGAGSGIDTLALVDQLVAVERDIPQQRIDDKRTLTETQISDFGLLNSALSTLNDAADILGNADTFNSKSAAFTDSTAFIPVSLDPEAQVGEYAFTISQLASSQSLSTDAIFASTTEEVGLGTLTFTFGRWDVVTPPADPSTFTQDTTASTQTITIDNTNNSLTGLANAINDADFGVQASIVNDGANYRLVMRADSGLDKQLQITASESGGSPSNTDNTGLSRFAFSAAGFQMTQNQVGQDAQFTVNGLAVTRQSNTIDDVIEGFEYTLAGTTGSGETVNISIEQDKTTAEQSVRDFVEAYNLFLEAIEPLIAYDEEANAYGSLYTDSLAKNMPSRVRQLLLGEVPGLSSSFTLLTNVGVGTERDGSLSIDEAIFTAAVDDNYDLFKDLFIPVTSATSDQVAISSYGDNTTSGDYDVVISTRPTKGNLVGTAVAGGLIAGLAADVPTSATLTGATATATLADFVATSGNYTGSTATTALNLATQGAGANDYDFTITVDGVASAANISLPVADYASYDAMATALQTAINADANLSGVSVSYSSNRFVFTSGTTGASSSVSVAAVGSSASTLGLGGGIATAGTGGANDYDFTLAVDGTTSGTISLTPGSYATFSELATHMQTQINADATLSGAGASVTVSHNGTAFVISSATTGVSSTIANATAVGSQAASLGITTGTTTQGATTGGNTTAYDFTLTLNGTTSSTISLDTGVYADLDAVAVEIETQINADAVLSAAGASVDVSYDSDNNRFTVESTKYGSSATVTLSNVGSSASDLGLAGGTSTTGIDVVGTIDGVAGFGSGNVLLPALGEPGESLGLLIGENATTATVNLSRGFGGELQLLIDQFLSSTGVISLREDALEADLEDLDDDQSALDRRIEAYQERLTSQFIAMEAIVRSLQDSSAFLESTLSNLLDSNNAN